MPPSRVTIGRIGAPYGLKGWVKVQSFTDPPSNLCNYSQGWLQHPEQNIWQPYQANIKQSSKTILFKFADCDNPETARKLTGGVVAIEREALPNLQKDEYYWSDLENLKVITRTGVLLGTVDYFITTGANDVIVVRESQGKRERLIPYIDDVIIEVNLKSQEIIVDWDSEF